ncbi:MAG: hypothetical protein ABR573_03370, partial [Candidatus Dormibacteria bacterium]
MTASHRSPVERGDRGQSFASDVRHELALQFPPRACCRLAEIAGISGAARTRADGRRLTCMLTSSAAARKLVRLAHVAERDRHAPGGVEGAGLPESHFKRGRTQVRPTYSVTLGPALAMDHDPRARSCCRRAYLRAAFMTAGDVSIGPTGTHLEFRLSSAVSARHVSDILSA